LWALVHAVVCSTTHRYLRRRTARRPGTGRRAGADRVEHRPLESEESRGCELATAIINGTRLFYEVSGDGEVPLVCVHGGWGSHHDWDLVVPGLAESFTVVTYDRRGHSDSERSTEQVSMHENVADAAALIEHLGLAPAWVIGFSFGATITLRLAGEHPTLLRGIIAHDPTLFSLLAADPSVSPMLEENAKVLDAVAERIASGDHAGAAEQFFTVPLGPGAWQRLPPAIRHAFITNAPTFPNEIRDPERFAVDLDLLRSFSRPALLTTGDQDPPFFATVLSMLADVLPNCEVVTFAGVGHLPHLTHPEEYTESVGAFIRKHSA
jgi:pimeloyl-ACP methyl ester carboxylesterase